MAWQHQPGQPLPAQSLSSFPGQSNTPLQAYPSMAYSQQSQIPPEVIAAAQAAGLGSPTREFRKSTAGSSPTTVGIQSFLRLTFIGTGVTLLVVVLVTLFTIPFPFNLISPAIMTVSILPFLPMILRLTRSGGGGKTFVTWSCPEGLVYSQNKQVSSVRWSHLLRRLMG